MTRDELLERGEETVTIKQIVERFEAVEQEYNGVPWTLKQIYTQIDMLVSKKPCGDCIRRSDIGLTDFEIIMCNGDYREGLKILLEKIAAAPSVTPMPKVGRWIYDKKEDSYKCSLCTFPCHKDNLGAIPTNYCAGCGAVMEVQNED